MPLFFPLKGIYNNNRLIDYVNQYEQFFLCLIKNTKKLHRKLKHSMESNCANLKFEYFLEHETSCKTVFDYYSEAFSRFFEFI